MSSFHHINLKKLYIKVNSLYTLTCTQKQHIVGPVYSLDTMHSDLYIMHISLNQQRLAANHTIHQEVILYKV